MKKLSFRQAIALQQYYESYHALTHVDTWEQGNLIEPVVKQDFNRCCDMGISAADINKVEDAAREGKIVEVGGYKIGFPKAK